MRVSNTFSLQDKIQNSILKIQKDQISFFFESFSLDSSIQNIFWKKKLNKKFFIFSNCQLLDKQLFVDMEEKQLEKLCYEYQLDFSLKSFIIQEGFTLDEYIFGDMKANYCSIDILNSNT